MYVAMESTHERGTNEVIVEMLGVYSSHEDAASAVFGRFKREGGLGQYRHALDVREGSCSWYEKENGDWVQFDIVSEVDPTFCVDGGDSLYYDCE